MYPEIMLRKNKNCFQAVAVNHSYYNYCQIDAFEKLL